MDAGRVMPATLAVMSGCRANAPRGLNPNPNPNPNPNRSNSMPNQDGQYDARRMAPATDRNRDAILAVLRRVLPQSGVVLEIARGTGPHGAYFSAALPG